MATEITRVAYRGLGIPDLQLNDEGAIWDSEVTVTTEQGRPGRPVDQGDSDLVLYANGDRAGSSDIHVRASTAGSIDPDGATFVWKLAGDTYYRARIPPLSIWGWDAPVFTDGSGSGVTSAKHPCVLALDDGTLLQANQQTHATLGHQIAVRRRTADTSWSLALPYVRPQASTANDNHCCLLAVPRGSKQRVYLFFWWQDVDADYANIRAHYSDDSGATWYVASRGVLPEDIEFSSTEYEGFRIKAAYRRGQIVLFVGLKGQLADASQFRYHIRQYASAGQSMQFRLVADSQGQATREGRFFDVVSQDDTFIFAYCNTQGDGVDRRHVVVQRLSDAFLPFTDLSIVASQIGTPHAGGLVEPEDSILVLRDTDLGSEKDYSQSILLISGTVYDITDGDLAMCAHDDGTLYLYRRSIPTGVSGSGKNEVHVFRSTDNGRVWRPVGTSDVCEVVNKNEDHQCATVWQSQDEDTFPYRLSATSWRGRVVVAHQWKANPGDEEDSVGVMYLGGYSTVPLPRNELTPKPMSVVPWVLTWLPIERPSDTTAFTKTGIGSDAIDVSKGALNISCSSQFCKFTNQDATGVQQGYVVRAAVKMNSGSVLLSSSTGLRLTAGSTVSGKSTIVQVRFSTTGIRVYDEVAGSVVGSDISVDMTAGVEIVCGMQDGDVALWYRLRSHNDDLSYALGVSGSLTVGGGAAGEIEWGVFSNDTSDSDWYEVHLTRSFYSGGNIKGLPDMISPDDLVGTPYRRDGVYLTDGVRLFASRGPALEGDEHIIGASGEYDLKRMLVTMRPSPRDFWRSKDDDSEHIIALSYEQGSRAGAVNTHAMSDTQYAVIDNFNFRTFHIEGYDAGTSSWVTVVDCDAAITFSTPFSWSLTGSRLKALGGGIGPFVQMYLEPDELVGWTAEMIGATTTLRRIVANTEGNTDGSLAGRKAVVVFEGADGTESITNNTRFWSNSMLVRWNLLGSKFAAYRIRIPAQNTVDGYFKIGTFHIGAVAVFGTDYSWGRSQSSEHGSQIIEAEDRTHVVTERAPVRRTVSIDWSDGVDTTNVSGDDPDPDYIKMSTSVGAEAVASSRDVPFLLDGLYRRTNGPATCVAYMPRLTPGPPDSEQLRRKGRDFLVGYIDGTVDRSSELGDELVDEVFRVGRISITEVV